MSTLIKTKAIIALIILGSYSCNNSSNNPEAKDSTSTVQDTPVEQAPKPEWTADDCVFDTSTYKFTTESLARYRKDIAFTWDDKEKVAAVPMEQGDTMQLHIGGCDHFSYTIHYTTDAARFTDKTWLIDKAGWLTKTFYDNTFDEYYSDGIKQKSYSIDSTEADHFSLEIISRDTSITDHVYEPVFFRLENNRTVISISGYIN